jgi:drug/metabolite transporter (DMT)-like permease
VREKSNFLAYIFLLLTVTFWAGNFIVGKFASFYEVPPFSLNFYRWFFAWLILAPFTIPEILKKKRIYISKLQTVYNFRCYKHNNF